MEHRPIRWILTGLTLQLLLLTPAHSLDAAPAAAPADEPDRATAYPLDWANRAVTLIDAKDAEYVKERRNGNLKEAIRLAKETLALEAEYLGPLHIDVAGSHLGLSEMHEELGEIAAAREHLLTSLEIASRQPFNHPSFPDARHLLADFETRQRMTDDQKELLEEAFRLAEEVRRYVDKYPKGGGPIGETIASAEMAMRIRKRIGYGESYDQKLAYLYLGILHFRKGDVDLAQAALEQMIRRFRESMGENSLKYAWGMANLGQIHLHRKEYDIADPLLHRSLYLYERAGGYGTRQHEGIRLAIGALALAKGDLSGAFKANRTGMSWFFNRNRRDRSGRYASILVNLARELFGQGKLTRAEATLKQALYHQAKATGTAHPEYGLCRANLAEVLIARGEMTDAADHLSEALAVFREHLDLASTCQSEREQLALLHKTRHLLDAYLSLAITGDADPAAAFAECLSWKGSIFLRQRQACLRRIDDPLVPGLLDKRRALLSELSGRTNELTRDGKDPLKDGEVRDLSKRLDANRRTLANRSSAYRRSAEFEAATPQRVVEALPPRSALVDFMEYARTEYPQPAIEGAESHAESPWRVKRTSHYAAFVLRAGEPIRLIDLGPAETVTRAVDDWRSELARMSPARDPVAGGTSRGAGGIPRRRVDIGNSRKAAPARAVLWEPVARHVADADMILVSPDGCLGRLPFAALPGKKPGTFLVEDFAIVHIATPQVLPGFSPAVKGDGSPDGTNAPSTSGALLLGGIDYDGVPQVRASDRKAPADSILASSGAEAPDSSTARTSNALEKFKPLPDSEREMIQVANLLRQHRPGSRVTTLSGSAASESAFRIEAERHGHVHLATHGYFVPGAITPAPAAEEKAEAFPELVSFTDQLVGWNPGLLSGIVLAGANRRGLTGGNDGRLTASELASLDLSRTDLLVLSGCRTGLGVSAGGEGLIGLLRAAQVAGAGTVLASLWEVNDDETQIFMSGFYEKHLKAGARPVDALRSIQLERIRSGARPRAWAGWVLSGDWR